MRDPYSGNARSTLRYARTFPQNSELYAPLQRCAAENATIMPIPTEKAQRSLPGGTNKPDRESLPCPLIACK